MTVVLPTGVETRLKNEARRQVETSAYAAR